MRDSATFDLLFTFNSNEGHRLRIRERKAQLALNQKSLSEPQPLTGAGSKDA